MTNLLKGKKLNLFAQFAFLGSQDNENFSIYVKYRMQK